MQICVGSGSGVCFEENLAGANLCRVFVCFVFWGEPGRRKFVWGLRLVCFRGKAWQVQSCVGSSWGVFSGECELMWTSVTCLLVSVFSGVDVCECELMWVYARGAREPVRTHNAQRAEKHPTAAISSSCRILLFPAAMLALPSAVAALEPVWGPGVDVETWYKDALSSIRTELPVAFLNFLRTRHVHAPPVVMSNYQ